MQQAELLEALLDLADQVGLEVRVLRALTPPEPDFVSTSACCRVKGSVWVVLSPNDPVDLHIDVLAGALKSEAATQLEARYLPPAIRRILEADEGENGTH